MANLVITNLVTSNVSLVGDDRTPSVNVPKDGTATVTVASIVGNVQFCDQLSAYITAGTLSAVIGSAAQTAAKILAYKEGDMSASIFDTDGDGIVDTSNDGTTHAASDGSDHTFIDQDVTSGASPVLAVTNMTGNAAGIDSDATAHAAADGSSHTFIDQDVTSGASPVLAVTNMTGSAAGLDSDSATHIAADGSDHTFIDQDVTSGASPVLAVTNMTGSAAGLDSDATTHIAADGKDHSDVVLNNTHRASSGIDHTAISRYLVQVVITAVGGVGGATPGTLAVQVNDLEGNAISRAVNLRLDISDTNGAGSLDAAGTCQFGAASTGTLIVGSGTASAIITTDATGLYESVTDNVVDETNYFSASASDGGGATGANTCSVAECETASATWSA